MADEVKKIEVDELLAECERDARSEALADIAFMGEMTLRQCCKKKHVEKIRAALLLFAEAAAGRTLTKLRREHRLKG
jgi:hypothetical protein